MLQQTQVKTVIPYWLRWMRELPRIDSLARARPARVLKLWEGLGYYNRARNLQSAARLIVRNHRGLLPRFFDDVLSLPGVGRYTAGAICSIAYNQPTPILDGNVIRVLTRLYAMDRNPREREVNERLWQLAEALVHEAEGIQAGRQRNCADLNQALMELGALVCTPAQPRCSDCPVRNACVALRQKRVNALPNHSGRPAITERRFAAFILERNGRFLVRQRPAGVVNARLWEFPNVEVLIRRSNVPAMAAKLSGWHSVSVRRILRIKHSITRHRITLDVYRVRTRLSAKAGNRLGEFRSLAQLQKLAFASAHRKILEHLRATAKEFAPANPNVSKLDAW